MNLKTQSDHFSVGGNIHADLVALQFHEVELLCVVPSFYL